MSKPVGQPGRKTKGSKRAAPKIGKVPAKTPTYILPFLQYVADSYEGDPTNQERAQKCYRNVDKFLKENWTAFHDHVEKTRPKKKQRAEQPYNETKLNRDTKTIVSKLETINEAIPNLNPDDAQENIDQIYLTVKQIRRELDGAGGEPTTQSVVHLPPLSGPVHVVSPPLSLGPAESTGTQSSSTSESSTSGPPVVVGEASVAPVAMDPNGVSG